MTDAPILALEDVRISYFSRAGEANVIPRLSFALARGEAMGLVGESGCGKSTVALAIVRYLGRAGRVVGGRILFEGRDVAAMTEGELRAMRGRRIAMVYQDPMASATVDLPQPDSPTRPSASPWPSDTLRRGTTRSSPARVK